MATTRLRKTFHYPADSGSDDEPETLDEEEQEKLIEKLRSENDEKNQQWLRFFLALPMGSFLVFVPSIFKSSLPQARLICILSITSLFATAYMLFFIPNDKPSPKPSRVSPVPEPQLSPVQQYLPLLNGALSALIALNGLSWQHRSGAHEGFWLICWLPAVVFATITMARRFLGEVDPSELLELKYGYKGA